MSSQSKVGFPYYISVICGRPSGNENHEALLSPAITLSSAASNIRRKDPRENTQSIPEALFTFRTLLGLSLPDTVERFGKGTAFQDLSIGVERVEAMERNSARGEVQEREH